jgi:5-methylcytosine-specific restriction endonuclease McrA
MLGNILVLDQSYQPIKIVSWMKAITLVLSGKAELVETEETIPIHSIDQTFQLTTIIRIFKSIAHSKKRDVSFTRHNIFLRDHWKCQYCYKQFKTHQLNWDHVVPRSRGGSTSWENIVTACYPCNTRKADRTPEEAGLKIFKKPIKPKATIQMNIRMKGPAKIPESWKTYLDPISFAYWHSELNQN